MISKTAALLEYYYDGDDYWKMELQEKNDTSNQIKFIKYKCPSVCFFSWFEINKTKMRRRKFFE